MCFPNPMTETEKEDMQIAKDAYAIFRGSQGLQLFPHQWDGLPDHYRMLLWFVVAHARSEPERVQSR